MLLLRTLRMLINIIQIYLPENATHNALQAGEYMRMLQITTSKEVILAASSI